MKKFNSLDQAINYIESQVKFIKAPNLDNIKKLYDSLNLNNVKNAKKIHVAGTNGKGSTSKMVSNILKELGYKVGTFMSPYLIEFNERILVNDIPISDTDLLDLINYAYNINETQKENNLPTYSFFELLMIISLIHFDNEDCDYIIMEVGIGGLHDSTNILNYDVSLITNIGTDHIERLGPTRIEVAKNKLGIVKYQGHLITTVDKSLKNLFKAHCDKVGASIYFVKERHLFALSNNKFNYDGLEYELSLIGDYQRLNATLAIEAVNYLLDNNVSYPKVYNALAKTKFAGRFEKISENIYIDGAHNLESAIALRRNINYQFHNQKVFFLISMLKDKDISSFLNVFSKDEVVLTSFTDPRFKSLEEYENKNIIYIDNLNLAYKHILNKMDKDDILMITGSLHFIGYVKSKLFILNNK